MSDPGHGDNNENTELPDDLAALGEQLHDALTARAGDDPSTTTAWVSIEENRGKRRLGSGIRPIHLLAAAAVVMIVAVSITVLLRTDEAGIDSAQSTTTYGTGSTVTSVPETSVLVPDTGSVDTAPLASTSSSSSSTSAPTSSTTSSVPRSTTSSSTTSSSTTTPTTTPQPAFELRGDGVGVAAIGQNDEATIAAVSAVLGPPAEDNPYSGPGFFPFRVRTVRWSNVTLMFAERNGGRDFAGWSYDASKGNQVFPMPNNVTLGLSAMQLRSNAPQPVVAGDLEGSTGLCFQDHGAKICGALDPPWQKQGTPDSGTVVSYVTGILAS